VCEYEQALPRLEAKITSDRSTGCALKQVPFMQSEGLEQ